MDRDNWLSILAGFELSFNFYKANQADKSSGVHFKSLILVGVEFWNMNVIPLHLG